MAERGALYGELVDALKAGGCPICRLQRQTSDSYLRALIYEGVTDPPLREELRNARGLCHRHAWRQAHRHGSALGLAIIYHDVVNTLTRVLEEQAPARRIHRGGLVRRLAPSVKCPACRLEEVALPRSISTLLTYLDDPAVAGGYRSAGGLCLPHLQTTFGQASDEQARILAGWQLEIYRSLRDELSEFIRKNDHRFKGEPIGEEGDSWLRAVARMAGESDDVPSETA